VTSNEAVNEPAGERAVEFQGNPQPRPALALVNGNRIANDDHTLSRLEARGQDDVRIPTLLSWRYSRRRLPLARTLRFSVS